MRVGRVSNVLRMTTATAASAPARPRPFGARPLLLGSALIALGSLLPWVSTPFGNVSGIRGAGMWTLYAGALGIAGSLMRRRRLVLVHAVPVAIAALVLPLWQLLRIGQLGMASGTFLAAVPGMGLVLVLGGGVLAARGAMALARPPDR